jgi:polysaccharide biosynthesis protein PslG
MRWPGAVLVVVALLLAAAPARGEPFALVGFNANFVPGTTIAQRTASYRRLYDAGVRAVRLDIPWAEVEPPSRPPHDYDFSGPDREVAAIAAAGLRVIGIIDYGNPRYSTLGSLAARTPLAGGIPPFYVANAQYFPPDDPAAFGAYARAVAAHYRAAPIAAWEIWNEENEGWRFWPPHEDPAAYADLLCAAHDAIRQVDQRPVAFGGLFFPAVANAPGTSATAFVSHAYAAHPSLARCSDAVAYHPYPYPFTAPELDVPVRGSVLSAQTQMEAALAAAGDPHKPVWVTEVGWPTNAYGPSEQKQAEYVARMEAASSSQHLPVLTWYTYGDYADPTGGANQEAAFGFFRSDGSPKPAYFALRTFSRAFAGTSFVRDLSPLLRLPRGSTLAGGRAFALEYRREHARVIALWYASESAANAQGPLPDGGGRVRVSLPVHSRRVTLIGYLGGRRSATARRGRLPLVLGPGPVYVVDRL